MISVPLDKRRGPRGLPALQTNQAANATKLTIDSPLQDAISSLPSLNQKPQKQTFNVSTQGNPQRPMFDPSSVGGPPATTPPAPLTPPKPVPAAATATPAATPSAQPNWPSGWPDWARNFAQSQWSAAQNVRNNYNYEMPPLDPMTTDLRNRQNQPSNINAVGDKPTFGTRFDPLLNDMRNQPNYGDQVAGNMDRFRSGVEVPGMPNLTAPEREADLFKKMSQRVGEAQPGLPGREVGVGVLDREKVEASGAQTEADKRAFSIIDSLSKNGGRLSDEEINQMLGGLQGRLDRESQLAMEQGRGTLAKLGQSTNLGANRRLTGDVVGRKMESLKDAFGGILRESIGQRNEALSAAGGLAGNIGQRESQAGIAKAGIGVDQRGQDINVLQGNQQAGVGQRGQDIGAMQANADRLSKEILGFADMDVKKYLGDRGLDLEGLQLDLQKRGMSLDEAKFKADEFGRAFDRANTVTQGQQQKDVQMAELALRADQGDVQAGLEHSQQLLSQAVANGQLDQANASMLLDDLYRYWNDPQEFKLRWKQLRDQYDLGVRGINASKKKDQISLGFGPVSVGFPV